MSEPGKIFEIIPKIISELGPIARNKQGHNFKFRGVDDLYNSLSDLFGKHGIFTTLEVISEQYDDRQTKSGGTQLHAILKIKYTFYAADGSSFTATTIGEGMDSGDKACNKAMSIAHKYALTQVFVVRTEDQHKDDADSSTPEATRPVAKAEPKKTAPPPQKKTETTAQLLEQLLQKGEDKGYSRAEMKDMVTHRYPMAKGLNQAQVRDMLSVLEKTPSRIHPPPA